MEGLRLKRVRTREKEEKKKRLAEEKRHNDLSDMRGTPSILRFWFLSEFWAAGTLRDCKG